jgi:hypothetical protein
MALQRFKAPTLPVAPDSYNSNFMSQLTRALTSYFNLLDSTTPIQVDSMILSGLPTNGAGLAIGSVYSDNGTLKIVVPYQAYAASLQATATLGDVSVTTA